MRISSGQISVGMDKTKEALTSCGHVASLGPCVSWAQTNRNIQRNKMVAPAKDFHFCARKVDEIWSLSPHWSYLELRVRVPRRTRLDLHVKIACIQSTVLRLLCPCHDQNKSRTGGAFFLTLEKDTNLKFLSTNYMLKPQTFKCYIYIQYIDVGGV